MQRVKRFWICSYLLCVLFVSSMICDLNFIPKHKFLRRLARRDVDTVSNNKTNEKMNKRQILPGAMYASVGCAPHAGPLVGCAPPVAAPLPGPMPIPPPPPPPPGGRLIPQALPGAPCEPGVECTGGSVCSMGICLCPPELVQEGTVCVSRTIYGVGPPPPPPPQPPPPPPPQLSPIATAPCVSYNPIPPSLPAYYPPPAPLPVLAQPPLPAPVPTAYVGGACVPGGCMPGGFCDGGFCHCPAGFTAGYGGLCVQRNQPNTLSVDVVDSEEQGS